MTRLRPRYAQIAFAGVAVTAIATVFLRPRPTRIAVTQRAGDDTVVINQTRATTLSASVFDQYGRRLAAADRMQYRWVAGDSIHVLPSGEVRCRDRREAVVRVTFARLTHDLILRCRPVVAIEAPTWLDLVVGDSTRNLAFVARGPDGRAETELRGTLAVEDRSVATIDGTSLRPLRPGFTSAVVQAGDAETRIPIVVYRGVTSFVEQTPRRGDAMAMHIDLGRGDTMVVAVPKAAFWVTYFSKNHETAPPTIELIGDGSCTTGNGVRIRRMEEDKYAKYCLAGEGVRMRVAHGVSGAPRVEGTVALRVQW